MLSQLATAASDTTLPDRVDAVVIEKGRIAGEQSSRNWGWCRTQKRDRRELPLQRLSMRLVDGSDLAVPGMM